MSVSVTRRAASTSTRAAGSALAASGTATAVAPRSSSRSISQAKKTLQATRSPGRRSRTAKRAAYDRTAARCGLAMPLGCPVVPD